MARLPFVDASSLGPEFANLPMHQNFQRVYANSPSATRAFMSVTGEIRGRSALSARLRELAVLEVGVTAMSQYVFAHHVKTGLEAGLSAEEIRAVASGSDARFSELERDVLELAKAMTVGAVCADATFDRIRRELGDEQLMDLLFVVTHYIGMAVLLRTLQVELESSYRSYLDDYSP